MEKDPCEAVRHPTDSLPPFNLSINALSLPIFDSSMPPYLYIPIYTYIYMSSCNLFVSFVLRVSCLGLFFEFSLCLSRACLGKKTTFMYKWLKKISFSDVMELVFAKLRCVIVFRRVICSRCLVRRASCRRTRPPVDSVPSIRRRELSLSLSLSLSLYIYISQSSCSDLSAITELLC